MTDHSEPTLPADEGSEREDAPRVPAVDDVIDAAEDPEDDKRRTGADQAAANRENDPPA